MINLANITPTTLDSLSALTDPTRLQILLLLGQRGKLPVSEIAEHFSISRPAISHHLKVLKVAGLVHNERHGQEIKYWVEINEIAQMLRDIADSIENCCQV